MGDDTHGLLAAAAFDATLAERLWIKVESKTGGRSPAWPPGLRSPETSRSSRICRCRAWMPRFESSTPRAARNCARASATTPGVTSAPSSSSSKGPGFDVEILSDSGQPLAGAVIDVWTFDGSHAGALVVDDAGRAEVAWSPGTYFLSTDHGQADLIDEVWSNVLCPEGPAFLGLCDPTAGQPIILEPGQPTTRLLFQLGTDAPLFQDGFDFGHAAAWSVVVGGN